MTPPTDTAVPLSPPTASMPIVGVRPAWRDTFTSLRVPNFRLFTIGHIVATTAIGMQRIAQDWLVLELSGSVAAVGVTVAMQFAPMLVFGLLGGVLADRYPKRILLMITQSLAAALAVVLSVLALTGAVQVWHIYVIAFLLGLVTVVDTPARQSFVSELVGPHRLPNAISINSAVFQLGQLVGPAVGGLMITAIGSGWSFAINAVACCGVVLTLSLMNVKALMPTRPMPRAKGQMAEGVRYAVRKPAILWTVVMLAFVSVFALNMPVLLAAYASQVFDIGPGGYGLLNALVAAGALTGALASTRRGGVDLRIVIATAAAIGVLQATTGLMPSLFLFCALLVGGGVATLLFITAANSLVQLSANAGIRGRVMALYVLVLLGGQAIGGPLMGWLVEHAGPHVGMVVSGAVPALAAGVVTLVLLAKRRRTRVIAATTVAAGAESVDVARGGAEGSSGASGDGDAAGRTDDAGDDAGEAHTATDALSEDTGSEASGGVTESAASTGRTR